MQCCHGVKTGEDFHGFLAEFLHLAGEAELPRSQYKTELDQRLARKVRELCIAFRGLGKTFEEYCVQAGSVVQSLNEFDEDAKRYRAKEKTAASTIVPIIRTIRRLKMQEMEVQVEEHQREVNWIMQCVTSFERMASASIAKSQCHMTNTCPKLAKKKKADLKNLESFGNNDKDVEEVPDKEKV
ncbi:hypothetical protein BDV23DRAFT_189367 [Aspergillus alliaceus]|uniref:Uncharacterized protein n=1 Tax=Petromyces alliaceus TaxID=209559 RepID=A0A5N7BR42_PETAA|nr:hypothetical protein BDV23DRAFT_189367 [Aspergillus alliaceus]